MVLVNFWRLVDGLSIVIDHIGLSALDGIMLQNSRWCHIMLNVIYDLRSLIAVSLSTSKVFMSEQS